MLLAVVPLLASLAVLSPECQPSSPSFPGPGGSANATAWRDALITWRTKCLAELRPNGQVFDAASFATTYVQPFTMPWDRALWNETTQQWQVDAFLESLPGRADTVLLWTGYPVLGIDDRRQFELIEALPGGLSGQKKLVEQVPGRPAQRSHRHQSAVAAAAAPASHSSLTSPSASVVPRTQCQGAVSVLLLGPGNAWRDGGPVERQSDGVRPEAD